MGRGEQAQQLSSKLAVGGIRIDLLNRLPQRLESDVGSLALITLLHVAPLSIENGRQVGAQTVQDYRSGWGRKAVAQDRNPVQAAAFAVNRLRSDIVIGPDIVENEGQQYGKNYAELQEDCMPHLVIAAKRIMVKNAVQQHAYESCCEPGPEHQSAQFNVRHRRYASSSQKQSRSNFSPCIGTRSVSAPPFRYRRKRSGASWLWAGAALGNRSVRADLSRQLPAPAGSGQPIQLQTASPMTSSRSRPFSNGNSSVNKVTHCRQEHGMRVMSVPQNIRSGPKASKQRLRCGCRLRNGYASSA